MPRRIQHQLSIVVLATLAFVGVVICLDRALPPNLSRLNDLSLVIEDRNGRPIHVAPTDTGGYRLPVSIQQVDRRYIDMLVKYEDKRFFQHPGVDPFALFRAVGQWITNGRVISGGSTLTMQTARLLETRPRTVTAKLAEILRALQLEKRFSKNEILEMYMTLAPFGGRIDSVRAASLAYFGQEPKYLTDAQAALLVVLPQAPSRLRPDRHPEKATAARAKVLSRVGLKAAEDFVSPVPTQQRSFPQLARQLAEERRDIKGIVRTNMDFFAQQSIAAIAEQTVRSLPAPINAAIIVVENKTRSIVAHVGNAAPLDMARHGYLDLTKASRSPGSSLKPLIYAKAFDTHILHPKTVIADQKTRFGSYTPRNFDRADRGLITATKALQLSLNTPAVKILDRLGPVRFFTELKAVGVPLTLPKDEYRPSLAVGLGGMGIDLKTLVRLYSGMASDGRFCDFMLNANQAASCSQTAAIMTGKSRGWIRRILTEAPRPVGWATTGTTRNTPRVAFKTGTSYGHRDTWAIGFDDRYTVGVWVGRPDGAPMKSGTGLATAAPLLFSAFGHLPRDQKPTDTFKIVAIDDAPLGLRYFDRPKKKFTASTVLTNVHQRPQIAFPPDGVQMLWGDLKKDGLTLKIKGGKRPLNLIINGRATNVGSWQRAFHWRPDGPGTYEFAVVDRDGHTSNSALTVKHSLGY